MMDLVEELLDPDRERRRKSEGKFYSFLNRSAQSLTRSKSQDGKARRAKDKEQKSADKPVGEHADARTRSRLPTYSNSQEMQSRTQYSIPTTYTSQYTKLSGTSSPPASPSRSPPHTPHSRPARTTASTNQVKRSPQASSSAYSPRTPAAAARPSSPGSPTPRRETSNNVGNTKLLLNRPLARPITPSNSNSSSASRRVLGILLPSTNPRKGMSVDTDVRSKRDQSHLRSGSGSSHEPLLPSVSRTSTNDHDHRHLPRPSTSTHPNPSPGSPSRTTQARPAPGSISRSPIPSPTSPSHSQRIPVYRDEDPSVSTSASRKGTPKIDFWRSATPRAGTLDQLERPLDKGKQRALPPMGNVATGRTQDASVLHSPQPRAPVAFIPQLPKLQRTPPTPQKGDRAQTTASVRVDSFMSDSMPLPLPAEIDRLNPPAEDMTPLTRHPAFTKPTPPPVETKPSLFSAPILSIQRSKSAPGGSRGRSSPCLRIPSPKFLSKDKDEKSREKRKVTPESVGSPIIRETRLPSEKPAVHSSPKFNVRRAMLPSFDFERPGSRGSSKSGYSEVKGPKSDDERENEKTGEKLSQSRMDRDRSNGKAQDEKREKGKEKEAAINRAPSSKVKHKAPSPVPPLPAPRTKTRSPPPLRTRSPTATTPTTAHSQSTQCDVDDSALPRLSSSFGRRSTSRGHRPHASHPSFSFEPASSASSQMRDNGASRQRTNSGSKPVSVRVSDQYVDTQTGLVWAPTKLKENTIPEEGREVHYYSLAPSPRTRTNAAPAPSPGPGAAVNGPITPRELEEATEVIAQFKNALNEVGFASLQKYVRRFDAQLMPLEGSSGLLIRVQRLLESYAPRVDERRKKQLLDRFTKVVKQGS